MKERRYTIQELSELTGFSIRTIRYYVHEGLIDPPAGRGRGGFYFDSQLNQLKQIKALQEKGMRLSSIVQYLKGGEHQEEGFVRDVWVKYEIAPGIEINVRRDVEERDGKKVLEIIKTVKSIVREEPDEER
jgi:DNA-binding transcriptional MerR regulator